MEKEGKNQSKPIKRMIYNKYMLESTLFYDYLRKIWPEEEHMNKIDINYNSEEK